MRSLQAHVERLDKMFDPNTEAADNLSADAGLSRFREGRKLQESSKIRTELR